MSALEKTKEKAERIDGSMQFQSYVLSGINKILREALECNTEEELGCLCLNVVEEITQSKFSFIGEISPDGRFNDIAISSSGCDACKLANTTGHRKEPMEFAIHNLYGQVLLDGKPVIYNNLISHSNSIELPEGHPNLKAFLGAPLKDGDKTIGIIGLGNREGGYTTRELEIMKAISPTIEQVLKYKKSQEALKLNEQRYRELLSNTSDGVFSLGIIEEGCFKFIGINPVEQKFIKVENNQVVGKKIDEVYPKESVKVLMDNLKRCIETRNLVEFEDCQEYNSKINYFSIKLIPVEDNTGRIYRIFGIRIDITERVRKEETIQQQKDQLEAIIENMSDGLMIFDSKGEYILFNKAARDILLTKLGDMKNTADFYNIAEFFDSEGNKISSDHIPSRRVINGEKFTAMRITMKVDDWVIHFSVTGTPVYDKNGNFLMGVLCGRDISQRVKYEGNLAKQREQLQAIVDSMSDGLMLLDDKYLITFLNKSAKGLFYGSESINNVSDAVKYNKYCYDIDGEEIPFEDLPAFRVLNKGKYHDYRITHVQPDKKIYISVNGSPIYDKQGKVRAAILYLRNITKQVMQDKEIRYQQETVLKAEKEKEALESEMKMKDEFLSIISHEFRTPLNVIHAAIQTMECLCGNELSDKSKKYIRTIRQNTFRQLRLVNNLLDITRANAGRIKIHKKNIDIVFLTKAIIESVYTYASQKGVSFTFVSSFKKKIIAIDDEKYERILLNLFSNAIKFSSEGKLIIVKLRSIKGSACIEVKDNGIGIPKDKMDTIFERFGQVDSSLSRQAEGAGIGLSLVKKLVEALGGSISVKSKVGKGSTFTIMLPNEKVMEEHNEKLMVDLLDNRLLQVTNIEFSDIYL